MKHPDQVKKLHDVAYKKRYKQYFGQYFLYSFMGLLVLAGGAYYFLYPAWPKAVLLVLYCSGLALCFAMSSEFGHRRALAEMQSTDVAGPHYRAPQGVFR